MHTGLGCELCVKTKEKVDVNSYEWVCRGKSSESMNDSRVSNNVLATIIKTKNPGVVCGRALAIFTVHVVF